ncbi:hypothetical protein ACFOSV_00970 [Algoriphagus namhaensis]|uniref:Uncharacterized protein n=1 Tax=Algoriphagus namhaensis TaxID=915353 RepID=A0ABV8AMZ0_9BACT
MEQKEDNMQGVSLVQGGLIYAIILKIQGRMPMKNSLRNKAIIMALLTWIPLAVLSTIRYYYAGKVDGIPFFKDISMYTRFLFVVPLFILLEGSIDKIYVQYLQTTSILIKSECKEKFRSLVSLFGRLSNSFLPEIFILVSIYTVVLFRWENLHVFESGRGYLVSESSEQLTLAGWYFILFSFPVYQLLVFRWIWRVLIWLFSVLRFSRFKFNIEPMHADQMGGLAYLNLFPFYLSQVLAAFSSIYASMLAIRIMFEGDLLQNNVYDILVYVLTLSLLLYVPLLAYLPILLRLKNRGVHLFGRLISKHNNDYLEKWIYNNDGKEPILGAMDNSSLNDINGSYLSIANMKLVPIDIRLFLLSAGLILIPFLPLVFTIYSPAELFEILLQTLFGT